MNLTRIEGGAPPVAECDDQTPRAVDALCTPAP